MKKFLSVLFAFMLIIPCAGLFAACGNNDEQQKLVVENMQNVYYLNEELNLENAVIKYSSDGKDAYVDVTDEMIRGFSTKSAGAKTMYIIYQGEKIEFNYTVLNLAGATFESTRVYKLEDGKEVDVESFAKGDFCIVFNRDGTYNSTSLNQEQSGIYTILTNGNIKLSYTEDEEEKTVILNKKSDTRFDIDRNYEGQFLAYELQK